MNLMIALLKQKTQKIMLQHYYDKNERFQTSGPASNEVD